MSFDFSGKRVLVAGGSRGIGRPSRCSSRRRVPMSPCALAAPRPLEEPAPTSRRSGHRVHAMTLRPRRRGVDRCLGAGRGRSAGRDRRAGQQRVGLRHGRRRTGPGRRPLGRRPADGAQLARRAAVAAALGPPRAAPSIVHISSIAAFRPSTRTPAYAAVKAAMNSYTVSQAALLSRAGHPRQPRSRRAPSSSRAALGTSARPTTSDALRAHPEDRFLRSFRHRRRGRRSGVVPGLAARALDHGAGALSVDGGQLLGA